MGNHIGGTVACTDYEEVTHLFSYMPTLSRGIYTTWVNGQQEERLEFVVVTQRNNQLKIYRTQRTSLEKGMRHLLVQEKYRKALMRIAQAFVVSEKAEDIRNDKPFNDLVITLNDSGRQWLEQATRSARP